MYIQSDNFIFGSIVYECENIETSASKHVIPRAVRGSASEEITRAVLMISIGKESSTCIVIRTPAL
jgi:hypothetical protein